MRVLVSAVVVCTLAVPVAWEAGSGGRRAALRSAPERADVVHGVVLDGQGRGLAAVIVRLERDGRQIASATTDARGAFLFESVAPGVYVVRAESRGFAPTETRVVVGDLPGPPLRLSIGIPAGADREEGAAQMSRKSLGSRPSASPPAGVVPVAPGARVHAEADARVGRWRAPSAPFNTASYAHVEEHGFRRAGDAPLSTFSIDVDTASYSNVRRFLDQGTLPPPDAVRVEELINYFRFDFAEPKGEHPVSVTTEVAACPWNPRHRLALVGLQARRPADERTPARNLVFLLDVSGSMSPVERLPLVQAAMRLLTDTLTSRDRVAIVVYAGASGLVLPSTPGDRKAAIHDAIADLRAGGSTNGAAGIELAYDTAASAWIKGGVNRVILATDGDFNVGVTSQGDLVRLIERQRERGIFLSVLGVGDDNLKDSTMEMLADRGNGNYAYLDSLQEARRVLVAEAGATLEAVARDVKVQVEFNPRTVGAYRLVGYENRRLEAEDFNDDRKDAGEMGAGHTVTVLYEIVPPGVDVDRPGVDPLKYQDEPRRPSGASRPDELMTVKVRYKAPDGHRSRLIDVAVRDRDGTLSPSLGFAAAVAQFGQLLRGSPHAGRATWASTRALAREFRGADPDGWRGEFIRLVDLAGALQARERGEDEPLTRR